jgi:DNA-binding FadR family transcriptional regulator
MAGMIDHATITFRELYLSRLTYAAQNPLQVYPNEEPAQHRKIIAQHTAIFDAIRDNNPDRAFDTMRRHIDFVLDFFSIRRPEGLR